jgi:hypothetical protein
MAFIEFPTAEAARRAITQSLSLAEGGGGGVWIDCSDGVKVAVRVEAQRSKQRHPKGSRLQPKQPAT